MVQQVTKKNKKYHFFVNGGKIVVGILALVLSPVLSYCASPSAPAKETIESVDPVMGDWQGTLIFRDGTKSPLVAQVIALGNGKYHANLLPGFDRRFDEPIAWLEGQLTAETVHFRGWGNPMSGSTGPDWYGVIEADKFTGSAPGRRAASFVMHKVVRPSPTLGAKPPAKAAVLFDGTSLDQWEHPQGIQGFVDLAKLIGAENCAAYLRTEIWSEKKQQALMQLGSDDGVKVWLNGQLVHANNVMRNLRRYEDTVKVTLKRGWNKLMLKVTNYNRDWATCVRIVAENRKTIQNISEKETHTSKDKRTRRHLDKNDGFFTLWSVSGPYRRQGKSWKEIFDVVFAPEKSDAVDVVWQPIDRSELEKKTVQWKLIDGAMEITPGSNSIISKQKFTDFKLHLEFRTPFLPQERGQWRGNSGVYLQGRYEVQVLDSYALQAHEHRCGGIIGLAGPRINMCAPPMQWQTYDFTFHAPRFDSNGKKIENACLTAIHNGVKIHDNVEVPRPTAGALDNNVAQPGGVCLQGAEHGNRVQYRNIWLVELP